MQALTSADPTEEVQMVRSQPKSFLFRTLCSETRLGAGGQRPESLATAWVPAVAAHGSRWGHLREAAASRTQSAQAGHSSSPPPEPPA